MKTIWNGAGGSCAHVLAGASSRVAARLTIAVLRRRLRTVPPRPRRAHARLPPAGPATGLKTRGGGPCAGASSSRRSRTTVRPPLEQETQGELQGSLGGAARISGRGDAGP